MVIRKFDHLSVNHLFTTFSLSAVSPAVSPAYRCLFPLSLSDVVAGFYHSWAFMTATQRRCRPLFQELLLLVQPLSLLPFDLNLLLEPRLGQMCSVSSPAPPCSTLLMTSWPKLQAEVPRGAGERRRPTRALGPTDLRPPGSSREPRRSVRQGGGGRHVEPGNSIPPAGPERVWWLRRPLIVDGVEEEEGCRSAEQHCAWSPRDPEVGPYRLLEGEEATTAGPHDQAEVDAQGGLRWAKLFGAAVGSPSGTPGAPGGLRGSQRRRSFTLSIEKYSVNCLF